MEQKEQEEQSMQEVYEKLLRCYESVRGKLPFRPKAALVLGSGLGGYADEIRREGTVSYSEIEGFPVSTVPGHKGRFVFGYVGAVPTVIMQGRVHYYEGYEITDVVLPIRLMKLMGADTLFLTNAAGGINSSFHPGELMLIEDQIASFVPSVLRGENLDALGPRFSDMSEVYSGRLRRRACEAAKKLDIPLKRGVYIQLPGPAYETPAEIRMCRALGADAVGMSTACEAVVANHMGMEICGISCITNLAAGMSKQALSHSEVQENADRVAAQFKRLLTELIASVE